MATLLLLGLAVVVAPVRTQYQQPCRETVHGADSGLVRMPDFGPPPHFNVTCFWSHPAQADRKLLVRVDSVHLPPDEFRESSLKLVLDDEVIDIPRNCVRCLKQNFVSAGRAKVLYKSVLLEELSVDESPSDSATRDLGSFQIRYKSFDPSRCDSPKQPLNGFASTSGRELGREVVYGCRPPYDVSGPDRARCRLPDDLDSPVPEWTSGPPKCVVTNCSSTVYRTAGVGAVSSPGYPLYVIPSALDCRWILQADPGSRIQLVLNFLQLSERAESFGTLNLFDRSERLLYSFNETIEEALTLSTNSSEIVVSLATTNARPAKGGFYMEYQLLKDACPEPDEPENGRVLFTDLEAGSKASYRCLPEYNLSGEVETVCQSNGTWSGVLPRCIPHLDFRVQEAPSENSSLTANSSAASKNDEAFNSGLENPKVTKSTKKSKIKTTVKWTEKSAIKIKSYDSPKTLDANSSELTNSGEGADEIHPKESKGSGKNPTSLNSAHDKITEPKNKENSTNVKQKQSPDLKAGVVQKVPDSSGLHPFPHLDTEEETKVLDVLEEEEEAQREEVLGLKSYIIIGVASTVLVLVLALVLALVIYRRRFPVRLSFGRKFSTFENPVYVSKDAQHTRELKRLTI